MKAGDNIMIYYFNSDIRLWYDHDKLIIFSFADRVPVKLINKKVAIALFVVMNLPEEEAEEYLLKMGYANSTRSTVINKYGRYLTKEKTENLLDLQKINSMENKKLEEIEGRASYPLHVQWIATYKCKHNCIYCGVNRLNIKEEEHRVSYEIIKKRLLESYRAGVRVFSIHGGDSLFEYDDCIFDLIKELKNYGCDIIVSTKSNVNDKMIDNIRKSALERIQLSVDTNDELLEQDIYQRKGHYENIITSAEKLKNIGLKVTVNIIVMNINYTNIPELVKQLSNNENIESINLSWYLRTVNNPKHLEISDKEKSILIKSMQSLLKDTTIKNKVSFNEFGDEVPSFENKSVCANGRFKFMIFPDGSSGICDFINKDKRFVSGNIKDHSISEIWNSREYKNMVFGKDEDFSNTKCIKCSYFQGCRKKGMCYSNMLLNNNGNYGPDYGCKECGKNDNS